MVFKRKTKRGKKQSHKFCPVCGVTLKAVDTYCVKCGYSFADRHKKSRKTKWRNVIIVTLLLIAAYFGIRLGNGQTLFPRNLQDAFSTFLP